MFKKKNSSKIRCFNHRKRILEISQNVKALHIGGSFSSVEILDTIFFNLLKRNDKFILSKGHCGILLLYLIKKLSKNQVNNYCKKGADLGVHPEYNQWC